MPSSARRGRKLSPSGWGFLDSRVNPHVAREECSAIAHLMEACGGSLEASSLLKELVHRPAALILHVLEDVGVAPEGHRRIGVAEHLGDGVQGHALAEG